MNLNIRLPHCNAEIAKKVVPRRVSLIIILIETFERDKNMKKNNILEISPWDLFSFKFFF